MINSTTTTTTTSTGQWPTGRGDRATFAAEFGEARAARFEQLFASSDPLADALFTSGHTVREIMASLRQALKTGEPENAELPEVVALIADMRVALDGVDWERVERGRRVFYSLPPVAHALALGPGSLVHTYATPAIANVLVNTGELTVGAVKRLAYTTNWIFSLFLPGSLEPGGTGFSHSGMVRAMHAHVRRVHATKGFDYSEYGLPISQFDMLRTLLDFTVIPYAGLRSMGWQLDDEQLADVFYIWNITGRMIGIEEDLLVELTDMASSVRVLNAIHAVDGEPNQASQDLVDALIAGFQINAKGLTNLPDDSLADWTAAYIRIIHGEETADSYGVAKSVMQSVLELDKPMITERYELLRANPAALAAEIAKNEATLQAFHTDDTSYNNQDNGIVTKAAA